MTKIDQRLAQLEASRSGRAVVLAWLAEAHTYPSMTAYLRSTLDEPTREAPLARIRREIWANTVAARRKSSEQSVHAAVADALPGACLSYAIAHILDWSTRAIAYDLGLKMAYMAVVGQVLAEAAPGPVIPIRPQHPIIEGLLASCGQWLTDARLLLVDPQIVEGARAVLEARYLDGHPALFADVLADWATLRLRAATLNDRIAELAERLPRSVEPVRPALPIEAQIDGLVADLVERARLEVYGQLGDAQHFAALVEARLRRSREPALAVDPDDALETEPEWADWRTDHAAATTVRRLGRWRRRTAVAGSGPA